MADDDRAFKVTLSSGMPKGPENGWDDEDFAEELDGDRALTRYARVAYNVKSMREVTATGQKILAIQLLRIEPTPDSMRNDDEQAVLDFFEHRTGQATLFPPRSTE